MSGSVQNVLHQALALPLVMPICLVPQVGSWRRLRGRAWGGGPSGAHLCSHMGAGETQHC